MISSRLVPQKVRSRIRGYPNVQQLIEQGLNIESNVWFGAGTFIDPEFASLITIGKHTTFGPRAVVLAHDASMKKLTGYTKFAPVNIGEYVFVGCGAIILPGTTLGNRVVVAAGSVVHGNIPANTVVGGNPAIPIAETDAFVGKHKSKIAAFLEHAESKGVKSADLRHRTLGAKMKDLLVDGVGYVL